MLPSNYALLMNGFRGNDIRYAFGEYALDIDRRELSRNGAVFSVEPQVFDVCAYLIANRDYVVSRDELVTHVWQGRFISDAAISTRIRDLRTAVGDSGALQAVVKTYHGRGFRFIADVVSRDMHEKIVTDLSPDPVREESKPSIAVLPFKNLGNNDDQDYFVDGVCDDIITALSRINWLFVIARNSTFSYKGQAVDIRSVSRELGVRYVLEGSVQRHDDRVRISVKLLNGETAAQIWAERYDRKLDHVFAVQDEITENIVGALEPQVSSAENLRSLRKQNQNLDAWDHVIRAMALIGEFTNRSSKRALDLLDLAIKIDPKYARAYSQKSWTIAWRIHQGWEVTEEALPKSIEAAELAVKYDPDEPWAYVAWLFIATITRDSDMLRDTARRALQINPNFAMAHSWMGAAYALTGDGDKAFEWIEKARRLSPRDMFKEEFDVHTCFAYFQIADYENACKFASKAMLPRPEHVYPRLILAASHAHLGNDTAAKIHAEKIRQIVPNFSLPEVEKSCVFVVPDDIARFVEGLRQAGLE